MITPCLECGCRKYAHHVQCVDGKVGCATPGCKCSGYVYYDARGKRRKEGCAEAQP